MNKITFEEHTESRSFITDLGIEKEVIDPGKMEVVKMGRYGVWSPVKNGKGHKVIEIGDNIKELQNKYSIEDELVLIVNIPKEDTTNKLQ